MKDTAGALSFQTGSERDRGSSRGSGESGKGLIFFLIKGEIILRILSMGLKSTDASGAPPPAGDGRDVVSDFTDCTLWGELLEPQSAGERPCLGSEGLGQGGSRAAAPFPRSSQMGRADQTVAHLPS